ncbi:rhodanese-like domain-containing protein [Pseudoduganella sp. R-34]|uniref:rhodanese-like domain-containing protein n=1 Tax=Pseudoduganella sp. R-34 TaxID=3404062 RepID=UPI003CFA4883
MKIARNTGSLLAAVLFHFSFDAQAQVRPGSEMPDALKGIPPAVCRGNQEAPTGAAGQAGAAQAKQPDFTCALAPAAAANYLRQPGLVLADLRASSEFERFHAQDAIGVTASQLRTQNHWRDKPVLLIGSGKAEGDDFRTCAVLRANGYSQVRVLRGGMPAWMDAGLPVNGSAPSAASLARLSAEEFWAEGQDLDNVVLLAVPPERFKRELSFAVPIAKATPEAIRAVLERRKKETKGGPLNAVVLAMPPATTDGEIQALRQALAPVPLLAYTGGQDEFALQLRQQQAVWQAHARGPRKPPCRG